MTNSNQIEKVIYELLEDYLQYKDQLHSFTQNMEIWADMTEYRIKYYNMVGNGKVDQINIDELREQVNCLNTLLQSFKKLNYTQK